MAEHKCDMCNKEIKKGHKLVEMVVCTDDGYSGLKTEKKLHACSECFIKIVEIVKAFTDVTRLFTD